MSRVLVPETQLAFPSHTVVTASAGAGKTYTLSWRFVQYLLGASIPRNRLRNLLAVTFTKNAAAEMKQRIVSHLKAVASGKVDALQQAQSLVSGAPEEVQTRAANVLDLILRQYSDLQVWTIDSFLERIFCSSALELQLPPDFRLELSSRRLFAEAFEQYAAGIRENQSGGTDAGALLSILDSYDSFRTLSSRYQWKPSSFLRDRARELHDILATLDKPVERTDTAAETAYCNREFSAGLKRIRETAVSQGFEVSANFEKLVQNVAANGISGSLGKKSLADPLKKGKRTDEEKQRAMQALEPLISGLEDLQLRFIAADARGAFIPALRAIDAIAAAMDEIKRTEGRVLIHDVGATLQSLLHKEMIPDVYFRLGEQLAHIFIDEFQDTSPVQWAVMLPLIEEALSGAGSLFVVGDPKQSINLFRGADWRIMMELSRRNPFPSSQLVAETLDTNYRSGEAVVRYSQDLFCGGLLDDDLAAAKLSGLDAFTQHPREGMEGAGYTERISIPFNPAREEEEEPVPDTAVPERDAIVRVVNDCRSRGFAYSDIAVLASKNSEILECGQWLNAEGIPFLSFSSLDVRRRTIAGELFSLLTFLDSPVNDFHFAAVILGGIFKRWLSSRDDLDRRRVEDFMMDHAVSRSPRPPLYKAFKDRFPGCYADLFEPLLAVAGYLPAYDMLCQAYTAFDIFSLFPEEEAALAKLLEAAVESEGGTNLKGFLALAEEEDDESDLWSLNAPASVDAVRLMTIHKAKGLEFPVAITLLYDHDPPRPGFFVEDAGEKYRLLRLKKDSAGYIPEFETLYTLQSSRERADALNRLYVAFTRPELELYIVNVFKERTGTMPSPMLNAAPEITGVKTAAYVSAPADTALAPSLHTHAPATAPVSFRMLSSDESLRGKAVHDALAGIEFISGDGSKEIAAAVAAAGSIPHGYSRAGLEQEIRSFFAAPGFAAFFERKDGRRVYREMEIAGSDGRLYRIDRLVVDADSSAFVVDFKTGRIPGGDQHIRQISTYLDVLRAIYPDLSFKGYLAYLDENIVLEAEA